MNNKARTALLAVVLTAALAVSGCSVFQAKESSKAIDPPPVDVDTIADDLLTQPSAKPTLAQPGAQTIGAQVTLYFKDANGYVAPVSLVVPSTEGIAQRALEYMVEDGPSKSMLPKGFTALLPKGTKVNGIDIKGDQKLAIVDFSKQFADYNPQDERKILEAVTWTLTGFPTIDNVQIKLEGKPMDEMPVDGTPIDGSLSRAMGINLELSTGVEISQSTPVTIYYSGKNDAQYSYLVPVTRMVKRTEDIAASVVDQLIRGPLPGKGLAPVLSTDVSLLGISQTEGEGLMTVNFSDKLLGTDKKASPNALQAVVMSLTENTGAAKVQIMVGNDVKVTADGSTNYSQPVARPSHINPFKS
ncbi:MAG: GerMN domain-containing protein [Paenibacillaceae bacterium]|nr:GerMN domain-containing protein [Paenibacillaceae bacterium]